jgi:hypothetical protein
MNVTVSSFNGQLESSFPLPPAPPEAPTPPTPPTPPSAMSWKTWKWSWPAEEASTSSSSSSASTPSHASRSARALKFKYTPRPLEASRPAELELESFGGLIRLASTAEIERALQLRQALRDSAEAVRALARLRRLNRAQGHPAPEYRPSENSDKN